MYNWLMGLIAGVALGYMLFPTGLAPIQESELYFQSEQKCTANTYKPCKTVYLKAYVTK